MSHMQYTKDNSYTDLRNTALDQFLEYSRQFGHNADILELGVFQSVPGRSTMHKDWFPFARTYHGADIQAGIDVDIVCDVHNMSTVIGLERYDIVISCSTFEHFKYPHLAAFEISKILKPQGSLFIQTHSTFPIHAYPYDYFRFTEEALSGCFGTKNGITVKKTDYAFPATINSEADGLHSAWLNVNLFGIKTDRTPSEYVYELDTNL